jgi:uncharacterized protein (DUF58 family)
MTIDESKISSVSKVTRMGKMRCLPTRYGWIFIVTVFGMLAGSINYNNNLGFLFTFLLTSMAMVSLIHSYRNISGIHIESVETWPVFEKQPAIFYFHMREAISQRIGIRFSVPGSEETVADFVPNIKSRVAVSVPAIKRGVVSPGELVVDSAYPFGLFRFKVEFYLNIGCFVYPKPIPVHKLTTQDLLRAHTAEGGSPATADDFKGLRSYQNGDPIQRIFWKAYSRGQGLLIKEFAGAEAPALFFDWHKITAENIEKKLSMLCAMILKAHGLKLRYGLKLPGKKIIPDRDEHHKHRCLQALALF